MKPVAESKETNAKNAIQPNIEAGNRMKIGTDLIMDSDISDSSEVSEAPEKSMIYDEFVKEIDIGFSFDGPVAKEMESVLAELERMLLGLDEGSDKTLFGRMDRLTERYSSCVFQSELRYLIRNF
jgi:hypothetical protein